MDRRNFVNKSIGFAALGGLLLLGCSHHNDNKKKKFTIVAERCKGCGKCFKACEEHAIHFVNDIAVIDQARCEGCGDCLKRCEKDAIIQVA